MRTKRINLPVNLKKPLKKAVPVLGLGLVLLLSACGGSTSASNTSTDAGAQSETSAPAPTTPADDTAAGQDAAAPSTEDLVTIAKSRFAPLELMVAAGATVTFENTDPFAHTVTTKDPAVLDFDSGSMGQDATFEVTFDTAGTYQYFCQIHPTMRASVVVQ